MKRRSFLGLAASAATLPLFVERAFASPTPGAPPQGLDDVGAALRRAVRAGKPLLILVIPADRDLMWRRGHQWGELLNHGDITQQAPFALCEVACATTAAIKQVIPHAPSDEPHFVLVDTARFPAPCSGFTVDVREYASPWGEDAVPWEKRADAERAVARERIAALGALVRDAVIGPLGERIPERAAQADRSLSEPERAALQRFIASRDPVSDDQLAIVDRAAALVLGHRHDDFLVLASAVRLRLVQQPPRGAKWAQAGGCGVTIEGEPDDVGIACGMGHVPELSRRFLHFFTAKNR